MSQRFSTIRVGILMIILVALTFSCTNSAQNKNKEVNIDLSNYQIAEGYEIESVAAEPQLVAPVKMIFDSKGRMWVIEMIGYMTDFSGSKEENPNGQISILEDLNGNGVMDHKKIFLDSLVMPRSIAFAHGGLLYATPPSLWWVPINDNDSAGEPILVDSVYAVGGNVEHQPNGLMYNVDNWFYNAKSNARYRYRNRKWEKEYIFGRGQWGMTQDNNGILYYNDNSNQFRGDYFLPGLLDQNKNLTNPPGISMTIVHDQSVYPLQFTPVNRGYMKGVLDSVTHKLRNFTSASGPLYYTGDQYDGKFDHNSFVGGPEVNLVKRNKIDNSQVKITGEQFYSNSEFLVSPDEAFRPVTLTQGPDGWIYIIDMHRGIIQHKTYMTNYLRKMYLQEGLDTVVDQGRILRILPAGTTSKAVPSMEQEGDNLIALLQHPNSWQRLYAQQRIVEKKMMDLIPQLRELLTKTGVETYVPLHAFWSLEGLGGLDKETILDFALRDNGSYLPHAIKYLTTDHPEWLKDLNLRINQAKDKLSEKNTIYLATSTRYISEEPAEQVEFLAGLVNRLSDENRSYALFMALSQYHDQEEELIGPLKMKFSKEKDFVSYLDEVGQKIEANKTFFARKNKNRVNRDSGLDIFETNCSTCHGRDGKGTENLAPPLYQSPYLEDNDSALVMIVLHGLQGPVTIGDKTYNFTSVMPALVDNTEYSDQEIAAVLSFVKNAFGRKPRGVSARLVKALRDYPSQNGEPYTVDSLETRLREMGNGDERGKGKADR